MNIKSLHIKVSLSVALAALLWPWALPLSLGLVLSPSLYVGWRRHLHLRGVLRCDWLDVGR